MDINTSVIERIAKNEELIKQVKDRTTYAYLLAIHSLKVDCESIGEYEKACKYASEIIDLLSHNNVKYKDDSTTKELINSIWVTAYDTRARQGDFEAFCIAMEWSRPINKQFYLPRARLLKKHGVIQGVQDLIDDKLDLLVLNLPPRIGKALGDDTPILTKDGWKNHGDLKVGDYVLNNEGQFVKVLGVSDKCNSEYIIEFSNHDKIECHGNHEWIVYDRFERKDEIISTKDMFNRFVTNSTNNTRHNYRYSIKKTKPVIGENNNLPIDPYTLGVWLGDGDNRRARITSHINDIVIGQTIIDNSYSEKSRTRDKNTFRITFNCLQKDLQKCGMCFSTKTTKKYIPDCYFIASKEQRLELLSGLLDTDGTLDKNGKRYLFYNSDINIIEDVKKLISTFGWSYSIYVDNRKRCNCNKCYVIGFRPTFKIPCKLERKQLDEFSSGQSITIRNIKKVDVCHTCNCIQVEGGVYLAGKTMIPTHNSTVGLFLQAQLGGMCPDESILAAGHTTGLIDSFYDEMMNFMTDDEYRYKQIFPNNNIVDKSSEYHYIDLNKKKRFHTYNYVSIETGGTGKVQAERLLYCDDLVKDVEQANNPDRLEKLYHNYTSTIKDRKIQRLCKDGEYRPCPEIHINTPWSLYDVTSRVVENAKLDGNMDRVRIISVPCYDEYGESNFMYDYGKGFNKKYYHDMEMAEDPPIFSAKYLMQPVERDGLVFNRDNINFYYDLPADKPDQIVGYADVTHGGDDFFSLPIGYVYDYDVYIEDVLFISKFGGDDGSRPKVKKIVMDNHVTRLGIEKNNGGDFYSTLVEKDLKEAHYYCHVTTHNAPTIKSKRDRILACEREIKGIATESGTYRIYFKHPDKIKGNHQYQMAMQNLYKWNQNITDQKKQHDDFPDSIAGMITNVLGGRRNIARTHDASKFGI